MARSESCTLVKCAAREESAVGVCVTLSIRGSPLILTGDSSEITLFGVSSFVDLTEQFYRMSAEIREVSHGLIDGNGREGFTL